MRHLISTESLSKIGQNNPEKRRTLKSTTSSERANLFLGLVFVYFLTLTADLLHFKIWLFKPKPGHIISFLLFFLLFISSRFRVLEKRLLLGFLGVLSSCLISALLSCSIMRSLGYAAIALFTYVVFFLTPMNLMLYFDKDKILRLYLFSFVCIGLHALLQLLLSFFGIFDPFVTQIYSEHFARPQSWTYEPSYYALYATPFAAYINARFLLSGHGSFSRVLCANIFLLISTSTGGFFSYFVLLLTCLSFYYFTFVRQDFPALKKKLRQFLLGGAVLFCAGSLLFFELFLKTFFKFFHIGFFAHHSFRERWDRMVDAWDIFCAYPLFGRGLGGAEEHLYRTTFYNSADVTLHSPHLEMFEQYTMSNVFTEVLASLGLYGMGVFLLLGVLIWNMFISALKNPSIPQEERGKILALLISIIVMLVCLQFNQGLFRSYIWVHMGISVGYVLRASVHDQRKDAETQRRKEIKK